MDEDFLLAIQLQEQFDSEYETSLFPSDCFEDNGFGQSSKKRKVDAAPGGGSDVVPYFKPAAQPERPLSIVDESWEILDPSPDVRAMFLEFNDMFFWGKLSGVEVKWTSCVDIAVRCFFFLFPQTLLHEMIHALLFVTQNNRDRDGHGPEFCKHMNRINKATGTNITIYHSFHDEVDVYRQHWWRCNGPCQNRKPYFGYVKRAMNRAPSSLDPWWEDHRRTCGGAYTKIKEPEGYGKKGKKDGKTSDKKASGNGKDIRNIIPFSGKGFVLGVKSQSSTSSSPSHKPPVPAVKSPTSSPVSPPKKLPTPSSPAKSLTSPVRSGPDKTGISAAFRSIRPAASTGQKPPVKRSVSNTRVFVNIGGSPVRIPKPHSGSSSLGAEKIKQRSIEDLFNSIGVRKSVGHSPSNTETKRDSWTSPKSTTSAASASSSFPKQQSSSSASTSKPTLHSVTSTSTSTSSSSSSSSALMVSCPVCQAKVQESKINQHLDSCLSSFTLKVNTEHSLLNLCRWI
uniref:DNA-dependent metalloprotease SPRTN n=1 Tax=Seriola lalandi dorsalis TaxID=1841481 RepID=A0A3B4WQW3_SERLL